MNRIETPSHTLTAASDTESPSPRGQSTKGLKLLTSMIASVTDSPRSCPRDTRLMASPSPPGTSTQMDTDEDGPDKVRTCNKISNLQNKILCDAQRMAYLADHNQEIPQGNPEYAKDIMLQQEEKENLQNMMDTVKGELASLLPCPFPNCVHNTAPKNIEKTKAPSASSLAKKLAETHIDKTNNKNKNNQKDGFSYPGNTAKKLRILENYDIGAIPQIETSNKFSALAGSDSQPALTDAAIPVAPPKIPPIMLKFKSNYNLIMQEINRKFPTTVSKLSGEYLKIYTKTADDQREITEFLDRKNEEYYDIPPISLRPQKIMAPLDTSKSAPTKPEALVPREAEKRGSKPDPVEEKPFSFIDAINEIRQLFVEYPFLMDLGRQLRNAVGPEKVDVFYRHITTFV
ncbi:hypothetical protein TNCT_301521 [Trichonephila clavata]|uniref:Uncharacterized protein n=1 Tax=Trichonephila clavata TaxID=2740835 RepID=A0A8X6LI03_TRICU|nr:hypothetical protein TNCT_301521 [Trichonephila clavata]